jgi:hypothetical protein
MRMDLGLQYVRILANATNFRARLASALERSFSLGNAAPDFVRDLLRAKISGDHVRWIGGSGSSTWGWLPGKRAASAATSSTEKLTLFPSNEKVARCPN